MLNMDKMQVMLEMKEDLPLIFKIIKMDLTFLWLPYKKLVMKKKIVLGMDVAASEFYVPEDKTYDLDFKSEGNAAK